MNIPKANKVLYRHLYKTDSSANSYEVRVKYDALRKHIPQIPKISSILEIGYGTGDLLHYLSNKYPKSKIYGYELVDQAEKLYRKRFPNDKKVILKKVDISQNFANASIKFDLIIASHVIEHIENEDIAIRDIYKSLKVGGRFILVVPDWGDFHNDLHFRQYSIEQIQHIAKAYKWKLTNQMKEGFLINRLIYFFSLWVSKRDRMPVDAKSTQNDALYKIRIIKFIYYRIVVNVFLYLNKIDSVLFSAVIKKPMQWTAIYKK